MTKVLIADALKPSIVMSSEIFKDKIPGSIVFVAGTGEQALLMAEAEKPDICLVDFDLPDVDGPALVRALRKVYAGPILLTAFPDDQVAQAVLDDLFAYQDASAWIKKPVRFDELAQQIDKYLIEKRRTGKRFDFNLPTKLVGKSEGRGKRTPKVGGKILNLSLGGACIKLDPGAKVKAKQEMTLSFAYSVKDKNNEAKIKAKVAWISKDGQVGLKFSKLTDDQAEDLEGLLRGAIYLAQHAAA